MMKLVDVDELLSSSANDDGLPDARRILNLALLNIVMESSSDKV